ncbi:MCE family protein [Hoyosella rhizosphaerae]|uniref:MCE family protein n=1 Tax=Hoyosella rhizosphaerae TaxID=1755582 RepID=A0A916XJ99_9ACTN|nr:MCE family protein [Hoyosella rhizosphaerae]MBN4925480.1 MCE family protein [Hoyosella rhizosphaerae]GGC77358.1 hypothetical protein GCM10011410_33350 [Hoyosella rhizosphaerae]
MKSIRGLIFGILLVVISTLLIARGAGALDQSPKVYVDVPSAIDVPGEGVRESGLLLGSNNAVRYEGVIVGRVSNIEVGVMGDFDEEISRVELQVDRDVLANMPNDALARIVPRTIFGDNEVHLVAPHDVAASERSTVMAERGDVLGLDTGPDARELYNVYEKVMRAVYELNIEGSLEGLRELRVGVEGRGEDLGNLIVRAGDLFDAVNPMIDGDVIPNIRRIAENVDQSLPDLVVTLDQSAELADMLNEREAGLRQLLVAGSTFTRDTAGLVSAISADTIVVLDSGTVAVGALNQGQGVDGVLNSLGNLGRNLAPAFQAGRLNITALATLEDPFPYSPADCARYPGLSSPTCGPAQPRPARQAAPLDAFPVQAQQLDSAIDGLAVPQAEDLDLLLNNPLALLERELMRGARGAATPAAETRTTPSAATATMLGPIVRGTVVEVR